VQFKFGAGASPVTIDSVNKTLRNLPAGCNLQQLAATAVLPSGYSIAPNPATVQDYTKGVNFTITGAQGSYNIKLTALAYDSISNPYGVYTVTDLSNIRHYLNGYFVLMNDIQLPNTSDANANDNTGIGDYSTNGWYSIGSHYVNGGNIIFQGSLDGQNHVIKNLAIAFRGDSQPFPDGIDTKNHVGKSNDGLFGMAVKARFKNIGIQLGGDIAGIQADASNAGVASLVGYADTCTFSNCYVTGAGTISGTSDIGGLIGVVRNSTVSKCYSSITHASGTFSVINGGGLIGNAYTSTISSCYSSSDLSGNANIGGLIGGVATSTVQGCYASGKVVETPSNGGALIPSDAMGGLIGAVSSISPSTSIINNCYATGSLTGASSGNASFLSSAYIGGLIGVIPSSSSKVTVTNCYASGAISRTFASTNPSTPLTGGLVGNTFNGVFAAVGGSSSNYWDKQATNLINLGGGNANIAADNGITANGKTTTDMKTQATYSGWDFTTVWAIEQNKNNGYPYLR
jgi:hypothetical protein